MWEVQMVLLSKGESGGKEAGHHLQKNGVPLSRMGWHLLPPLESMKVKVLVTQSCPNLLWPHGLWPARLLCPWNFPGKNAGVGCHSPFQGIFLTQRSNLSLLHCREILYHWATWEGLGWKPKENFLKFFSETEHKRQNIIPFFLLPGKF